MRIYLSILLLLTSVICRAQSPYDYFNSDAFWQKMVQDSVQSPIPTFGKGDTIIVAASTRILQAGNSRFIGETRDAQTIRYYFIFARNGKWHIHPFPSLGEAIKHVPDLYKDWVIYTEGMGKIFTSGIDRGMQMAAQYGVHVLYLDYPSIRTTYKPLKNYKFALRNANNAYKDFMPVLDTIKALHESRELGYGHITLFFHSMGNNVMRKIAQNDADLNQYNGSVWADNLVLNSPCVPRKKHNKWVDKIHFTNKIYVHYNPKDGTLKWARLAGFRQIMGEHIKKPLSKQAVYINFNPLCGDGHSNFLNLYGHPPIKPTAFAHYNSLFHGETVNLQDTTLYVPSAYRHIGWTIK